MAALKVIWNSDGNFVADEGDNTIDGTEDVIINIPVGLTKYEATTPKAIKDKKQRYLRASQ
ncbi:hypothetical protein [Atopobium sp. oral taxon 810]|uniref:hypothetical protein n=1 Tax=Atopobium sp. oral taxon 810 TaxID=712158 RepID=UPI000429FD9B|nr:hypothetical protein [Atopobium sp. oral taxon 810]